MSSEISHNALCLRTVSTGAVELFILQNDFEGVSPEIQCLLSWYFVGLVQIITLVVYRLSVTAVISADVFAARDISRM